VLPQPPGGGQAAPLTSTSPETTRAGQTTLGDANSIENIRRQEQQYNPNSDQSLADWSSRDYRGQTARMAPSLSPDASINPNAHSPFVQYMASRYGTQYSQNAMMDQMLHPENTGPVPADQLEGSLTNQIGGGFTPNTQGPANLLQLAQLLDRIQGQGQGVAGMDPNQERLLRALTDNPQNEASLIESQLKDTTSGETQAMMNSRLQDTILRAQQDKGNPNNGGPMFRRLLDVAGVR
jgi:hypothetical protein